jgi:hypothetical protein
MPSAMDDDGPSSHHHPQSQPRQNLSSPQQRPLITAEVKDPHGNLERSQGLFFWKKC